jgi:hypothetical protein
MPKFEAIIDIGPKTGEPGIADDQHEQVGDEIAANLTAEAGSDAITDLRIVVSPVGAIVLFSKQVPHGLDPETTLRSFVRQALARGRFADWQMLTSSITALHGQ